MQDRDKPPPLKFDEREPEEKELQGALPSSIAKKTPCNETDLRGSVKSWRPPYLLPARPIKAMMNSGDQAKRDSIAVPRHMANMDAPRVLTVGEVSELKNTDAAS